MLLAATALEAEVPTISKVDTRDRRIVSRWKIAASPRALALAENGTLYVGLSDRQSVVAIDSATGKVMNELVLDHAEIASTKELVSMRISKGGDRLIVANGSDESVTIIAIPELKVVREIGLEGEPIHDAVPDPEGRYLYVLGSRVHVYDWDAQREIRTLEAEDPMTITASEDGRFLAVTMAEKFESGPASVVALYDVATLKELAREPLETDRTIRAAMFGADGRALVFIADDWLAEKSLVTKTSKQPGSNGGTMRIRFDFGDLVSSQTICLVEKAGPQSMAMGKTSTIAIVPERRCSRSGAFTAAPRSVTPVSIYGIAAYALAYDARRDGVWATDPAGYLTMYKTPVPETRSSR